MRALVLKNTLLAIALIASSIIPSPVKAEDTRGDILVKVIGLRNNNGVVRIALFNSSKSYTSSSGDAEGAFQKVIAPIQGQVATSTLSNLPYGEYAIKCFHDEDNSGRFLTNKLGIPKVEYGFSNNAHGLFGPAPYDKAKFILDKQHLDMTIKAQR